MTRLRWGLFLLATLLLVGCSSLQTSLPPEPPALAEADNGVAMDWHYRLADGWQPGTGPLRLQPALDGGALYVAYQSGQVAALDPVSGKSLWQRELDVPVQAGVSVHNGQLYLIDQAGDLVVLHVDDGSVVGRHPLSVVTLVAPVVRGNVAVLQGQGGSLGAYDLAAREWAWIYESEQPSLSLHGQMRPRLVGSRVISGFANGRLAAFDLETGEELWSHRLSNPRGVTDLQRLVDVDAGLALDDGGLFAAGYEGRLVELDPATGRLVWETELSVTASLAMTPSTLYVATRDGELVAYDRSSKAELWRRQGYSGRPLTGVTLWTGPEQRLVVTDRRGFAHVFDAGSGASIGRLNFQGHQNFTVPALTDSDRFYVQSMQGLVVGSRWEPVNPGSK